MKRAFIFFIALVMIFVTGCGNNTAIQTKDEIETEYNSADAVKGQIGTISYVVPHNAIKDSSSTEDSYVFNVQGSDTEEKYVLGIGCADISNEEPEKAKTDLYNMKETLIQSCEATGQKCQDEIINEFLGKQVSYGYKLTATGSGLTSVTVAAIVSNQGYIVSYSAESKYFNQSVWDVFYSHLQIT